MEMQELIQEIMRTEDPQKKAELTLKMQELASKQTPQEAMTTLKGVDNRVSEIEEIIELEEVAEMASMSYIAKKYFKKSRSWLCQRINGHVIHGKPAQFTEEERKTLAYALKDMAKKFEEKSLSITNG